MIVLSYAIVIIVRICSVIPIYLQVSQNKRLVTNKYLAQDAFGECARTTENLSKYTAVRKQLCTNILLHSRIFSKTILVSELYLLPRCIAPYKQSLSELKNNLRDAFINAKRINVTFYKAVS